MIPSTSPGSAGAEPHAVPAAAAARLFGLRIALALTAFETLLSLALGHSRIPNFYAAVLFVLVPVTIYGVPAFAFGRWLFPGRRSRAAAVLLLAGYAVLQLVLYGGDLFGPSGGGVAFGPLGLAALALGAPVAALTAPMRAKLLRLVSFHMWGVAVVVAFLWASSAHPVRRALPPEKHADGPNVVLISWDTVRADVLSLYGGTGLETPELDGLAGRSVVFEEAVTVAPITGPSHASMLTGMYPPTHGLRSNGTNFLAFDVPTLPALLADQGYATGAFVAGYPLLARFALHRGFQVYDDRLPNRFTSDLQDFGPKTFLWLMVARNFMTGRNKSSVTGDVVNERAIDWYSATQGPAFMWVHYYDAHGPFEPREPYRSRALAAEPAATPRAVDPGQGQKLMTLQRGEIAWLDHLLGELLAALEQKDPGLADTLVILTADHGECFGEGGIVGEHVPSLYEATQRVPLVVHLPGGRLGGTRAPGQVSQIDFAPTVLSLLELPVPREPEVPPEHAMQGENLLPLMERSGTLEREWLYMEAFQQMLGPERKRAIRSSAWKLVAWLDGRVNLYDLSQGDAADLAEAQPERVSELQSVLGARMDNIPVAQGTARTLSESEASSMAELGYADDADPDDEESRSAPGSESPGEEDHK